MRQIVQGLYDEWFRAQGTEAKSADAKAAILDPVVELLKGSERDVVREATQLINLVVDPERQRRSNRLRKDLPFILDGLDESGDFADPLLDLAFRLGTPDGLDKTLRLWTPYDFDSSVRMAYRKSAEAVDAAKAWDLVAERAVQGMHLRAVDVFVPMGRAA